MEKRDHFRNTSRSTIEHLKIKKMSHFFIHGGEQFWNGVRTSMFDFAKYSSNNGKRILHDLHSKSLFCFSILTDIKKKHALLKGKTY